MTTNRDAETAAFEAETAEFRKAGVAADSPEVEVEQSGSDDGAGDGSGRADPGEQRADAEPAKPVSGSDRDTDPAAVSGDDDEGADGSDPKEPKKPAAAQGEESDEAEPTLSDQDWRKKRLARERTKLATENAARVAAETRNRELEAEVEQLRGTATDGEAAPDPDDYANTAAYEAAKRGFEARKTKPAPKQQADASLPLGIDPREFNDARDTIVAETPPALLKRFTDDRLLLTAPVILEIGEEVNTNKRNDMIRFAVNNEKLVAQVAQLPPRKQAAAFLRAFGDAKIAKPKLVSNAPDPINPVNGKESSSSEIKSLSEASFANFEKMMDEKDKQEGRRRY